MKPVLDPSILKDLSQPAMLPWLGRTLFDWLQIITIFFVVARFPNIPVIILAWLLIGIKINALGLLMHDVAHFTLSKNRKINNLVGFVLVGMPISQSITGYRRFHFNHHRHQGTNLDPEIHYQSAHSRWSRPLSKGRVMFLFFTDLLGFGIPDMLKGIKHFKPEEKYEPVCSGLFLIFLFAISYKLNVLWIPGLWFLSGATSHWAVFRLRTLTEHGGVDITPRIEGSIIFRALLFPHNTFMHYEHHAYPTVPLWNLPELREHLKSATPIQKPQTVLASLAQVPAFPWEQQV